MHLAAYRRAPLARAALGAILALALGLAALALPPAASAQGTPAKELAARIAQWQTVLDQSASQLGRDRMAEADYDRLRETLSQVFDEAQKARDEAADNAHTSREMLDSLGPQPGENDPPEDDFIKSTRQQLSETLSDISGMVGQAELLATRADILLRTANERRIRQFAETLFLQGPAPLDGAVWAELPKQAQFVQDRFAQAWASVTAATGSPAGIAWDQVAASLLAALLATVVAGALLRRRLLGRITRLPAGGEPSYRGRVAATVVDMAVFGLLPALLTVAVELVVNDRLSDMLYTNILRHASYAASAGVIFFLVVAGLAWAVLGPTRPAWRLATVDDAKAWRLFARTLLLMPAVAASGAVLTFMELALVAPELQAVASFFAKLTGATALLLLLAGLSGVAPRLRLLAALTAVAVVGLALMRYHALGLYVAKLLVASAAVGGLLAVARGLARELLDLFFTHPTGPVAQWRRTLFAGDTELRVASYAAGLLADLVLLTAGLALMLPAAGIKWNEIKSWITAFLHGFSIGEVTIAPLDILAALLMVIAVLAVTRFIQRRLDERVLERLHFDRGVRHSIRTGIGYFGVLVALITGIGALGLNLSNLAMIASALSVGIGFGLQAIVSNFVAGLILLVERPVKVGDWIVIGDKEGVVKRISVRSTEIQTFQRSSVIVPNSELISGAVVNWTHKDKFGRIDIPVGVAYESDPELVRTVLMRCADADPRVTRAPAPIVVLRSFGDSALGFELRCFVADVDIYLAVSSDLRFAILRAFRENGIEMPYAQQVLHIPQLDKVVPAFKPVPEEEPVG